MAPQERRGARRVMATPFDRDKSDSWTRGNFSVEQGDQHRALDRGDDVIANVLQLSLEWRAIAGGRPEDAPRLTFAPAPFRGGSPPSPTTLRSDRPRVAAARRVPAP